VEKGVAFRQGPPRAERGPGTGGKGGYNLTWKVKEPAAIRGRRRIGGGRWIMNRSALARLVFLPLAALLAALSLIGLYGCGKEAVKEETEEEAHQREIPLRTLVQGSICEYGRFEQPATGGETGPAFLVLEDEEGLKRLLSLANLELPEGSVDFSRQVVIAAMQGPRNTSGYAISVVRAVQSGTDVRVEVEMVEPDPGSMTAQVLTSPFHLVLAEREDFEPRGELSFIFTDTEGETVERTAGKI